MGAGGNDLRGESTPPAVVCEHAGERPTVGAPGHFTERASGPRPARATPGNARGAARSGVPNDGAE
eukprot:11212173-Lingulodinium_polyedra.AAC.1